MRVRETRVDDHEDTTIHIAKAQALVFKFRFFFQTAALTSHGDRSQSDSHCLSPKALPTG